jgi:RHS repeat-associated protein
LLRDSANRYTDHLNTPRLIADEQQRTVWRWDNTDPFGGNPPDENPSGLGPFEFPLRFPGQYADKETNLHYNYFRDYDPSLGRYGESDPIGLGAGLNTYAYVRGDPLSLNDPFGLQVVVPIPPLTPPVAGPNSGGASNIARALNNLIKKVKDFCTPKDEDESCTSHLKKCLESGWGGKVGFDSACFACFQRCQGTGEWPDSVTSGLRGQFPVSCEYWLKR